MTDIMFEIPSNPKIEKCIITKDTVEKTKKPEIIINEKKTVKEDGIKINKRKPDQASA